MKSTQLRRRFDNAATRRDPFPYPPVYYAQLAQIGVNRNDNRPADLSVPRQARACARVIAEQASSLADEHIDRMFSSAIPRTVPSGP